MIKTKTHKVNRKGSLCFITFPIFEKHLELRHAFTTRHGGVSEGCFEKMNLSFNVGDNRQNVIENYNIICNAIGVKTENIVLSRQTHTANVLVVGKEHCGTGIFREYTYNDIDGLITNEPRVALVTHSADCCLLAFYDPNKKVIAAAHAGWRGTVKEIGGEMLKKMQEQFGSNPQDILVALAPSIGPCCYEVDTPVLDQFKELEYLNLDKIFSNKGNRKYMLNLWEANKQILMHYGIKEENIELTDVCTNCYNKDFHSHRATKGKRGVNGLIMEMAGE